MQETHVVDDDVDSLDIDTSTEDVGSDKYTFLESLELLEPGDTFGLGQGRVNTDGREVAFLQ